MSLSRFLPRRRWKRIVLYVVGIFLVMVASDMLLVQCWRHITVGTDTTRITTSLNGNGVPDYLGDIDARLAEGVTPENNAAPLLLQVMGTQYTQAKWRQKVLPALGLPEAGVAAQVEHYFEWVKAHPPTTVPAGNSAEFWNGVTEKANVEQANDMHAAPWKMADHPAWGAWLVAQRPGLAKAHLALQRQRYYLPLVDPPYPASDRQPGAVAGGGMLDDLLSHLMPALFGNKMLAQMFMDDAMARAGEGDAVGVRQDLLDTFRVVGFFEHDPTLAGYIHGHSIQHHACRVLATLANTPALLPPEALRLFLGDLEAQAALPDPSAPINTFERVCVLDLICGAAHHGPLWLRQFPGLPAVDGGPPEPYSRMFLLSQNRAVALVVPVHYNAVLRAANGIFDRYVVAVREPTYRQRQVALRAVEAEIKAIKEHPHDPGLVFLSFLISDTYGGQPIHCMDQLHTFVQVEGDLARVALALRLYKLQHGSFPDTLAPLAPAILKDVPLDHFIDEPLHYQRQGDGYLLYSVGTDMTDNHGTERTSHQTPYDAGWDQVVRTDH